MKKLRLTISFLLTFLICQLFINTELPAAETMPGNDESSAINASSQHPAIFFENPDFNFGQIYKGQRVEHIFKFENSGNDVLEINKVKTSCGCTAAILTNNTLSPGETGEIKATFNSSSYSGNFTKSITVLSNDPNTTKYRLTISGEIIEDVIIKPKNINFGSVYVGEEATTTTKTVTIKSRKEPDFKIEKITPSKPLITTSIAGEKDGEYIINVILKHNSEIGRFSGVIYLETNSLVQKKVKIPFFGEIVGDITTYPKRIYYGTTTEGKELTQKLFVKIKEHNIKILNTKLSPDFLSIKIDERYEHNNPHYLIEIKLHKEAAIGKLNGLLELYTNSKNQPVIKIPITGDIKKGK